MMVGNGEHRREVVIGKPASDHLTIRVIRRSHPGLVDYWDGNWVTCRITVRCLPFSGAFDGNLRTDELSGLRDDLARLQADLDAAAQFANLDGHLAFGLKGDGIGHFIIDGEAWAEPGSGRCLVFRLEIDQTDLAAIISNLDAVLEDFPVLGSPDDG